MLKIRCLSVHISRFMLFALISTLFGTASAFGQTTPAPGKADAGDSLKAGFKNPPAGARPRVWWHWMNGNISKEGIKLDLEWMHRVGLGGFQNFDAALDTPKLSTSD